MKPSSRSSIIAPIVWVVALLAPPAHAEDQPATAQQTPANPAVQAPKAAVQASPSAVPRRPPGTVQGKAKDGRLARGAPPQRQYGGQPYRGHVAWEGGRWRREVRNGRDGYWWDVGGVWYYYPQPMAGPPTYISEDYIDDVPYGVAAPVAGYAPPPPGAYYPPPPPPPDPAASVIGGAVVGGLLGGLLTGRAGGAAAGAIVGGTTGAIVGATAASRPGYYFSQGDCYYRYPSGQYVLADPRACY